MNIEALFGEKLGLTAAHQATTLVELATSLERFLGAGVYIYDGQLVFAREQVGRIHGLRIEIRAREHAPPHFHVTGGGLDASFQITDCAPVAGHLGRKQEDLVRYWHRSARNRLIEVWNRTRPADCPVGPIPVPAE